MKIRLTNKAIKQYKQLPKSLQNKTDKQFDYLRLDIRHPSLHAKKYHEAAGVWQGRIDNNWRFYFQIIEPNYVIVSIITHPK
jgi:mRNA-degrading endonuclease RelE of RelBE toxin-antitoxin system